jgi:hypothetical protein
MLICLAGVDIAVYVLVDFNCMDSLHVGINSQWGFA